MELPDREEIAVRRYREGPQIDRVPTPWHARTVPLMDPLVVKAAKESVVEGIANGSIVLVRQRCEDDHRVCGPQAPPKPLGIRPA